MFPQLCNLDELCDYVMNGMQRSDPLTSEVKRLPPGSLSGYKCPGSQATGRGCMQMLWQAVQPTYTSTEGQACDMTFEWNGGEKLFPLNPPNTRDSKINSATVLSH